MIWAKLQRDNVSFNLVQDVEVNMNFCDGYAIIDELLVIYANKGDQVVILDLGATLSLAERPLFDKYVKVFDLTIILTPNKEY